MNAIKWLLSVLGAIVATTFGIAVIVAVLALGAVGGIVLVIILVVGAIAAGLREQFDRGKPQRSHH